MHPPIDALQEYVRLALALESEIQRHVDTCQRCLTFVADARDYIPESEAESRILAALLTGPYVAMEADRHGPN